MTGNADKIDDKTITIFQIEAAKSTPTHFVTSSDGLDFIPSTFAEFISVPTAYESFENAAIQLRQAETEFTVSKKKF